METLNVPTLFMLIGLPGSGKSTFLENFNPTGYEGFTIVLSTDEVIEEYAQKNGKTYDESFQEAIEGAEATLKAKLNEAIRCNDHIIWDQTNLSVKSRKKKLEKIPAHYRKIAVVISCADIDKVFARLRSRIGKTISAKLFYSMNESFEYPTKNEGFDFIYDIRT